VGRAELPPIAFLRPFFERQLELPRIH
jgi:hypothetical protein